MYRNRRRRSLYQEPSMRHCNTLRDQFRDIGQRWRPSHSLCSKSISWKAINSPARNVVVPPSTRARPSLIPICCRPLTAAPLRFWAAISKPHPPHSPSHLKVSYQNHIMRNTKTKAWSIFLDIPSYGNQTRPSVDPNKFPRIINYNNGINIIGGKYRLYVSK
jgi:hypothetical protein